MIGMTLKNADPWIGKCNEIDNTIIYTVMFYQ